MLNIKKIKINFLAVLFMSNIIIFYAAFIEAKNNLLKVFFLDVGQGDAIFIESPNGNQLLIDGGPDLGILNALGRVMPFYDKTIDVVLVTHPDQDHIGGLPSVFKNYKVKKYLYTGATSTTGVFEELENRISESNSKRIIVSKSDLIDLGDGVILKILYPNTFPEGTDRNEFSIVAKLYYGDSTFLLTGDAPTNVEQYLAHIYEKELDSDVLKAAHHGSKNSLAPEFFSAVSPEYSIISAGKNNSFGHPHKEIVDALKNVDSKILGTYDFGDIKFISDGLNLKII